VAAGEAAGIGKDTRADAGETAISGPVDEAQGRRTGFVDRLRIVMIDNK
jgi:hypothetical protein